MLGFRVSSWIRINGIELEWEKIENYLEVIAHVQCCQAMWQGGGAPSNGKGKIP